MSKIEERAGVIFSVITTLIFVGAAFGVAQQQINANSKTIEEVEQNQAAMLPVVLETRKDVEFIREHIKRIERNR